MTSSDRQEILRHRTQKSEAYFISFIISFIIHHSSFFKEMLSDLYKVDDTLYHIISYQVRRNTYSTLLYSTDTLCKRYMQLITDWLIDWSSFKKVIDSAKDQFCAHYDCLIKARYLYLQREGRKKRGRRNTSYYCMYHYWMFRERWVWAEGMFVDYLVLWR